MKNKLLKTLTCFAGISAIGSTVAIPSTSCGCSSKQQEKALPESVYEIDTNNVLLGFKEGINLSKYQSICDTMQIPARVTSIATVAFVNDPFQEPSSTIPEFITKLTFAEGSNCSSIGNNAFQNSALISVDLLNSTNLTEICDFCFSTSWFLTSVTFPSGLKYIDTCVFLDCPKLIYITLPNEFNEIGSNAFEKCSALISVDFSNCTELSSIGDYAFNNCSSLNSVDFSNCSNLTTIGNSAFQSCTLLTSIMFPSSLTTIGWSAFYKCSSLTSVTLPDGLATIELAAFSECSSLASITFPSSLTTIEQSSFNGCSSLTSVKLLNCSALTTIGMTAFWGCSSLTFVTLPSSLTTIGTWAFEYCSNLSKITWDNWSGSFRSLSDTAFKEVCQDGQVDNIIGDDVHDSTALLQYLKSNGGLPSKWTAV